MPGADLVTVTRAYLSQEAVATLSAAIEIRTNQSTVISHHVLIVPPDVDIQPTSRVVDEQGNIYRVNGAVASRRGLRKHPVYKTATLKLISDLGVN